MVFAYKVYSPAGKASNVTTLDSPEPVATSSSSLFKILTVTPFALVTLNGIAITSPKVNIASLISILDCAGLTVKLSVTSLEAYLSLPLYEIVTG